MSPLRSTACVAIAAGALLAGCGGGPQGYTPPSPSTPSPVTTPVATGVTSTPTATATGVTSTPTATATGVSASPTASATGVSASPTASATGVSASPSATPAMMATATPMPVTTPVVTAAPGAANFHPSTTGTQYSYTGFSLTTYTRPNQYPSPEPTQTTSVAISQAVTVTNPSAFAGNAAAFDYHTVEQDTQLAPAPQQYSTTYDNYYAYTGTPYAGDFQLLGFKSADSYGDTLAVTYGTSGILADMLPEAAGQSWTNPPTATVSAVEPNNESSTQSIAKDGTYVTTITYPAVNAGGSNRTTATVTANLDGSGVYLTPRLGTRQDSNYSYAVSAPSGGTIAETTTIPPDAGSTAAPTTSSTSVPSWIPTGFLGTSLATETDKDMGPVAIPSGCLAEMGLGGTANEVVQTQTRVDPMLGQLETTTTSNYVVANYGTACAVIHDVLDYYYDFTGQNGVGYFSGAVQQETTLDETLGLSGQAIASSSRAGGVRFAESRSLAARVDVAQARVTSLRAFERGRFLRSMALGRHFDAAAALSSRTI